MSSSPLGWSQGGHVALAVQRALEQRHVEVTATAVIGAVFDVERFFLSGIEDETTVTIPLYVSYLLLAYDDIYDVYDKPSDVFRRPYEETVPGLLDMQHYWDDILAGLPPTSRELLKKSYFEKVRTDPNDPVPRPHARERGRSLTARGANPRLSHADRRRSVLRGPTRVGGSPPQAGHRNQRADVSGPGPCHQLDPVHATSGEVLPEAGLIRACQPPRRTLSRWRSPPESTLPRDGATSASRSRRCSWCSASHTALACSSNRCPTSSVPEARRHQRSSP